MDHFSKQALNGHRSLDSYVLEWALDSLSPTKVTAVNVTVEDIEHEVNGSKTMQILQKVPLEDNKELTAEFTERVVEVAAEQLKLTLRHFHKTEQLSFDIIDSFHKTFEESKAHEMSKKVNEVTPKLNQSMELSPESSDSPTKVYQCEICDKTFKLKHHLARHKFKHVEDKPYSCETCRKCFKSRQDMNRHSRLHTGTKTNANEPELSCNKCEKTFTCKNTLVQHLQTHLIDLEKSPVMPYSCDTCSKSFPSQSKLNMHNRSHQENPFFCEYCEKFFSNEENFRKHNLMHSEDRKYKCSICTLGFKKFNDMQKHVAKHKDDKYYFCKFCNKAYTQKYHRDKHERAHEEAKS